MRITVFYVRDPISVASAETKLRCQRDGGMDDYVAEEDV